MAATGQIEAEIAALIEADDAQAAARSAARLSELASQNPHPALLLAHASDPILIESDRARLVAHCQKKLVGVRITIEQKQRVEQHALSARLRRAGRWLLDRSPTQRLAAFFTLVGLIGGWLIIQEIDAATFPSSWRPAYVGCEFQIRPDDQTQPTIKFPIGRKMMVEARTGRVVFFHPISRHWTEGDDLTTRVIAAHLVPGCKG